ncbi:MAG: DUF4358 domain-containing protein [Oscillospiraceae bacterium]
MKRVTALALVLALALTGCTAKKGTEKTLTPEERTELYKTAITAARDEETNRYQPILTRAGEGDAEMVFALLGVTPEDMSAYALSVSLMNVKAYAVAAVYPAAGKEDAVLEGLRAFVDNQKQSFEQYLADQYEIAVNARLETLEDGTVLLVMCENQDAVFDAISDAIVKGK